jgi:hypothetical protein
MRNPIGILSIAFVAAVGFSAGTPAEKRSPRGGVGSPDDPTTPPNIVMIVADDLDKALFDRMMVEGKLPNIHDHIVVPGVTFNNAFNTEALCGPSRATYLTGQYPPQPHGAG